MKQYTFELNDEQTKTAEEYAKKIGQSVPEIVPWVLLDYIKEVREGEEAWAEFEKDPVTYTLEEVEREILKDAV